MAVFLVVIPLVPLSRPAPASAVYCEADNRNHAVEIAAASGLLDLSVDDQLAVVDAVDGKRFTVELTAKATAVTP